MDRDLSLCDQCLTKFVPRIKAVMSVDWAELGGAQSRPVHELRPHFWGKTGGGGGGGGMLAPLIAPFIELPRYVSAGKEKRETESRPARAYVRLHKHPLNLTPACCGPGRL